MEVICPQCGKIYRKIPPELRGKRIRCRECQSPVQIPAGDSPDEEWDELPAVSSAPARSRVKRQAKESVDEQSAPANKKKKKRRARTWSEYFAEEWSLKRVFVGLCLVLCVNCWVLMAGRYARDIEGWTPGEIVNLGEGRPSPRVFRRRAGTYFVVVTVDYLRNSIAKIPRAPQVLHYGFTVVWPIPLVTAILLLLLAGGIYGLSRVQKKFDAEDARLRRSGMLPPS